MDPFTQKMLLKAEQRSKVLSTKVNANQLPLKEFNKFQDVEREQAAKPVQESVTAIHKPVVTRTVKKTFGSVATNNPNDENDDYNVEINITTAPNVEVEVQVLEKTAGNENELKEVLQSNVRDNSRKRLDRLATLYNNAEALSSPINRTEHKFCEQPDEVDNPIPKRPAGKGKFLKSLANSIRQWEDEGPQPTSIQPVGQTVAKVQSTKPKETVTNKVDPKIPVEEKKPKTIDMKWDKKVITSLEAQGFQRKDSITPKIAFDFSKATAAPPAKKTSPVKIRTSVTSKIKAFENEKNTVSRRPQKDPTELSLKERMQLFEKNKGPALVPKNFYAGPSVGKKQKPINSPPTDATVQKVLTVNEKPIKVGKLQNFESLNSITISEATIKEKINQQKQADMEVILNRFKKPEIPTPPPLPPMLLSAQNSPIVNKKRHSYDDENDSLRIHNHTDDSKRARIVDDEEFENDQRRPLYPSLNGFDLEESNVQDTPSSSFSSYRKDTGGASDEDDFDENSIYEEEEVTDLDDNPESHNESTTPTYNNKLYLPDSTQTSDNSTTGLTDYLDEALDEDLESVTEPEEPPNQQSMEVESVTKTSEDDKTITLVHTVSFYRRQQGQVGESPVRKITRTQQVMQIAEEDESNELNTPKKVHFERTESVERFTDQSSLVNEKIDKLLNEVCKQQQIIGQTSQALHFCASTMEFSGSAESVEGERHLLVATHRRQACLDEIQRLRVDGYIRSPNAPKERGCLMVKDITIPLGQDYVRKLATCTITGHHLVCLLKYNETVLATKSVPTLPGLVAVKFPDVLTLDPVYGDFKVTLEVYGMTAEKQNIPHEIKYHIDVNKKTPKKKISNMVTPLVAATGGVPSVRSPALTQYGFAIFSLREIQRNTWTLAKMSPISPLSGTVSMRLDCELEIFVEYTGFLTMFEEISGFGAWHRRWCRLNGHMLNYWKYPDDEKKRAPIGSIDLSSCSSTIIQTAPRDICARLNTILVECSRSRKDSDTESLVIVPRGNTTIVRSLLSADTKEERDEWCAYLNKSLTLLRAWNAK